MANELDPRTRKEVFLAGMLYGDPDDLPDPNTRDELYMKAIAETIKEGGVPSPEGADVGDVLTIGADGPEWAAPSGGNKYQHFIGLSNISATQLIYFSLIMDTDTPFASATDLVNYLEANYKTVAKIPANGTMDGKCLYAIEKTGSYLKTHSISYGYDSVNQQITHNNDNTDTISVPATYYITDNVIAI